MNDGDGTFSWTGLDIWNGMTLARNSDVTRGIVFDWDAAMNRYLEFEVIPSERDLSDDAYLSFRACQGTRHPQTIARLGDLTFTVTLRDGLGTLASINFGAFGGGVEEPYQRTGYGIGAGWQNEFETIRIRLTDFLANGSPLDLRDIQAVRFDFGPAFGDDEGRIGVDDVQVDRQF